MGFIKIILKYKYNYDCYNIKPQKKPIKKHFRNTRKFNFNQMQLIKSLKLYINRKSFFFLAIKVVT